MAIEIANSERPAKPFLNRVHPGIGDIAATETDAIAILLPQNLDFRGHINLSVAAASGVDLDEFILENIYKPHVGDVYALPGFDLPCRHILMGVMPHFRTEFERQDSYLSGVCRKIMELGHSMLLQRIAFPFLGPEEGYPKARAARLMVQGISDRLDRGMSDVRIVCPDEEAETLFRQKLEILGWPGCHSLRPVK